MDLPLPFDCGFRLSYDFFIVHSVWFWLSIVDFDLAFVFSCGFCFKLWLSIVGFSLALDLWILVVGFNIPLAVGLDLFVWLYHYVTVLTMWTLNAWPCDCVNCVNVLSANSVQLCHYVTVFLESGFGFFLWLCKLLMNICVIWWEKIGKWIQWFFIVFCLVLGLVVWLC